MRNLRNPQLERSEVRNEDILIGLNRRPLRLLWHLRHC